MKQVKQDAFWMVYGENCSDPSYKHDSHEAACNEARRLAMQHRGTRYYVLFSMVAYVMPPESPERIEIGPVSDDSPF